MSNGKFTYENPARNEMKPKLHPFLVLRLNRDGADTGELVHDNINRNVVTAY